MLVYEIVSDAKEVLSTNVEKVSALSAETVAAAVRVIVTVYCVEVPFCA